jgi:hypothetical protein
MVSQSRDAASSRRPAPLWKFRLSTDEHDGTAELLVGCDQQVPVVAPRKAFAAVVVAGPVDQP